MSQTVYVGFPLTFYPTYTTMEWDRLDSKRALRIRKTINLGGWKDPDKWGEIHPSMVNAMIQLEKALRPFIQKLEIETV